MAQPTIRVLCVDDHRIVREGIVLVLGLHPDLHVIASAATGEEAVALFEQHRPDVTVMDLRLPRMSGVDAIEAIRRIDPVARIIALTVHQGDEDIYRALAAGASAYLLKDVLSDDLVSSIRKAHRGESDVTPMVAESLSKRAQFVPLTRREVEILKCISQGLRNKEISVALGIVPETVHVHLKSIFVKLDVHDRTEAVCVGLRRGIIHIP
jgi:two-component system NarL family response regulator